MYLPTFLWQQVYLLLHPSICNFSLQQDHFATQPFSPAISLQHRYLGGLDPHKTLPMHAISDQIDVSNFPVCSKIWLLEGWYHSGFLVCFFSNVSSCADSASMWQKAGSSLLSPLTPQLTHLKLLKIIWNWHLLWNWSILFGMYRVKIVSRTKYLLEHQTEFD